MFFAEVSGAPYLASVKVTFAIRVVSCKEVNQATSCVLLHEAERPQEVLVQGYMTVAIDVHGIKEVTELLRRCHAFHRRRNNRYELFER